MLTMRRPSLTRSMLAPFLRFVALLACIGQVALVASPIVEARSAQSASLHIEGDGPGLHHAHNPDLCPACAGLELVVVPAVGSPPQFDAARHAAVSPEYVAARPRAQRTRGSRPRAPPVRLSESSFPQWINSDTRTTPIHAFINLALRPSPGRGGHGTRAAT